VDFRATFPDESFDFEEVPLHLMRHNFILPDYTLPPESVSEQHLWHSISISRPLLPLTPQSTSSRQQTSPLPPLAIMVSPMTMLPHGHSSTPHFNPEVPQEFQRYFQELEMLFGPAQIVNNISMLVDMSILIQQIYGNQF
jgi:hypothetical protein